MAAPPKNRKLNLDRLPTLPAIAVAAIRIMAGEPATFASLAELINHDQVLASRILHYANSAAVGAGAPVTTIAKAISVLGFNAMRSIVLSVAVFDSFAGQTERDQGLVNFWLHSLGVAVTAELLAAKLGFAEPAEAYLGGLIHDLGKLACQVEYPEKFTQLCQELDHQGTYRAEGSLPLELESLHLGTSHLEVGRAIASQWGFPESLARCVWMHHQPVYEPIIPNEENLPKLIRFADVLTISHHIGSSYFLAANAYVHANYHYALEQFMLHQRLTVSELDEMMSEVYRRVREMAKVVGFCEAEIYRTMLGTANASLGEMGLSLEFANRQQLESNRVLAATCAMGRRLKSGLSMAETAREILQAIRQAFTVSRCLCLIRDEIGQQFLGQLHNGENFELIAVPVQPPAMSTLAPAASGIEREAVQRLQQTSIAFEEGSPLPSGLVNFIANSQFISTFFVADKEPHGRRERITGQLLVEFAPEQRLQGEFLAGVKQNFEILALAAGNAVERLLLEIDLRRQTEAMAESARKMEESQRQLFHTHRLATVGRLAAGAAHEINNPLTIISLNLQIMDRLLSKAEGAEDMKERVKVISSQERRISKIIGELMGYARPSQPKFGEAGVADIMAKVLAVIGDRVAMSRITVENLLGNDLPLVLVDALQIEQVFMNLLINAHHAMGEGGKITLSSQVDETMVTVNVTDTGSGISRENLAKIFDPFFTTKKEGEGTGLGLAICHAIVEHNGGYLRVVSQPGRGSTFSVALPIDKGNRLRAMKKVVDQKLTLTPNTQENYRILVVDDERVLNDMLQECLRAAGYEVDGAYDGVEGIGQLRYKKYHLVLLDVRMPRKDGFDVLKFVKEEYPEVQVIIITGLAAMEEIKETVKMGAFACLKKPFLIDKVLEKVKLALAAKSKKSSG